MPPRWRLPLLVLGFVSLALEQLWAYAAPFAPGLGGALLLLWFCECRVWRPADGTVVDAFFALTIGGERLELSRYL